MNEIGSEWGRWDLHVHTPASLVHRYARGGVLDPWEAFVADLEALPAEFRVVGLNDYLFLDGYRKLRALKTDGRLANIDLILPVIELRLNHFGGTESSLSRVNLHVLFSDELEPDVIQAQFLNALKCDLALTPHTDSGDWSQLPTRESLVDLGRLVIGSLPVDQRKNAGSELEEGFANYNVTFDSVVEALENPKFRYKHMLAVGKTEWADVKWTKQSAAFKKTLINRPHLVFTAADSPAQFAKSRQALIKGGVNSRLLDCSDAHHLSTATIESNRIGNCMTWINAIPSFEGLRHAYHEYEARVFIGDLPPKLAAVRQHPTRHVDSVRVAPLDGEAVKPAFDVDLRLNSGFVAIVGNKGKGKSALTDVIGLLGDSKRSADYSFLTKARFRDPKANLASKHEGEMRWLSGTVVTRRLDQDPDPATPDAVQYLPQNYLESVCNEGPGADELFSRELGEVIFSHVPEADRLGSSSLGELVSIRTNATISRLKVLRGELAETIRHVLELEEQLQPETRQLLESQLREKEEELKVHEQARPAEVKSPDQQSQEQADREREIEGVRDKIVALEAQLRAIQEEANAKALLSDRADELHKELETFGRQFRSFTERIQPLANELNVDVTRLIALTTDASIVDTIRARLASEREAALAKLSVSEDGSPARLVAEASTTLARLESELEAPQRAYQNYLSAVVAWERRRSEIIGSPTTPDSLERHRHQLKQLGAAPAHLAHLRGQLFEKAAAIHGEHMDTVAMLQEIYAPVQRFIDDHPIVRDRFNLSFEVTIVEDDLGSRLFPMLNRQMSGSFAGTDESAARLEELVTRIDFNDPNAVRDFLEAIDDDLHHDNRAGRNAKPTRILDQLRKGATAQQLYELVFGLEYLRPMFWLRSDEKPIAQLSPGQRGTLLLLFYLLVDRRSKPIILDQPEENLDNQTVHDLLAPAIGEARRERQVIVVTHNPNLAVVGDADQVVVAEFDGERFRYVSGAIEDPSINRRIVAILEGTWPAFQNRSDKYTPTSVLEGSSASG